MKEIDLKFNFNKLKDYVLEVQTVYKNQMWTVGNPNRSLYTEQEMLKINQDIDSLCQEGHTLEGLKKIHGWVLYGPLVDSTDIGPPYNSIRPRDKLLLQHTQLSYGEGKNLISKIPGLKRALLAKFDPGAVLPLHSDNDNEAKIHIPITSNDRCEFILDDISYKLLPGKAYYVDTTIPHTVFNYGDTERTHLVIHFDKQYTEQVLEGT